MRLSMALDIVAPRIGNYRIINSRAYDKMVFLVGSLGDHSEGIDFSQSRLSSEERDILIEMMNFSWAVRHYHPVKARRKWAHGAR